MGGQREGRKETDDREVGAEFRQRHSEEAQQRDPHQHVQEEKPRLRGWHSGKTVDADEAGSRDT